MPASAAHPPTHPPAQRTLMEARNPGTGSAARTSAASVWRSACWKGTVSAGSGAVSARISSTAAGTDSMRYAAAGVAGAAMALLVGWLACGYGGEARSAHPG